MRLNLQGLARCFGTRGRDKTSDFRPRLSYSIEAEDLLAETVFHVVLKHHGVGTYLDLGAAHPIEHSNTYLFYRRGWSGICVEPNPEFHALYCEHRPRDQTFNIGISPDASGALRYHRFQSKLINGFFGQEMLDRHAANGEVYLGHSDVECLNIGEFLRAHVTSPVDFLNIDVETLDARILGAWDWAACRPSVICAEIHTSDILDMLNSDVSTVLTNAGYTPMCRGWLSSIFVANEKIGRARSAAEGILRPHQAAIVCHKPGNMWAAP